MDCMDNQIPHWADYQEFMYGRLIALDKKPDVRLVGIRETWRQLFSKCVLKVTGPEANHTYNDDQICTVRKVVFYREVHGV